MAVAPAAPEAVGLGYMAVGLLSLLGCLVLIGLRSVWVHTFGYLLEYVASKLVFHVAGRIIDLGGWAESLNHSVLNVFLDLINATQGGSAYFFHGGAHLIEWGIREWVAMWEAVGAYAEGLERVRIPRLVKGLIYAAVPGALIAKLIKAALRGHAATVTKLIRSEVHTTERVVTKLPAKLEREISHDHKALLRLGAVVAGLAGGLVWPHGLGLPNVGKVWRGLTARAARIERRLRRLEALLGVTGMAIAIANVLGLPNWRCLTRGNLGKLSRAACGLSPAALEDILGLFTDLLLVTNICTVVELLEEGLQLIQGPIDSIVGEVGGSLCHGDFAEPPAIGPMQLSLPPVGGLSLSGV